MGQNNGNLAVSVPSVTVDMVVCLAAIAIAIFPTIISKKFKRWQGITMLAGYIGYVVVTVVLK
jgi:cation:H+ antiporter